jgi:hypothetical protein
MDARIRSSFHQHPKVARLTLEAVGLWLKGLLYACANTNGGFVPASEFPDMEHIAAELVDAKLWQYAIGGWEIHDFYQWNPEPNRRWLLADAVRRGAGVDQFAWDHNYQKQITDDHLKGDITPAEVEAITHFIIQSWSTAEKSIIGIPKFQTIVATRGNWRLRQSAPGPAVNYFMERINESGSDAPNPGHPLLSLAEKRDQRGS